MNKFGLHAPNCIFDKVECSSTLLATNSYGDGHKAEFYTFLVVKSVLIVMIAHAWPWTESFIELMI